MIFDEKHKGDEILLQEGAININDLPFVKHGDKVRPSDDDLT